jgi:hypothetical protein
VSSTGYSTGPEIRQWMTETTALFPVGTSLPSMKDEVRQAGVYGPLSDET